MYKMYIYACVVHVHIQMCVRYTRAVYTLYVCHFQTYGHVLFVVHVLSH